MVCAVGLDIHYELTAVSNESGAFQPRLKPFNPRMSGPACPYNYTGKFLEESEMQKYAGDPVSQGRAIDAVKPYDPTLYAVRDPRKVSKCVVIRDYGCKIPIDIADTEKVARAVLNHYPDQYIAFLNEFVSNIFGDHMKKHLLTMETGFQKLLDSPEELNRVSWSAYISVQGGIDPRKPRNADEKLFHEEEKHKADVTLSFSEEIGQALAGLTREGRQMTGQVAAGDMFDLRPCLNQHIQTLKDMRQKCQAFGTKEKNVLLMLYYCNEQGRNLAQDLQLMTEYDQPDYNRVRLAVPINLYHTSKNAKVSHDRLQPDTDTSIRHNLQDKANRYKTTPFRAVSVGHWSGNADSNSVLLRASAQSNFAWGWGHAANVVSSVGKDGSSEVLLAPYLEYQLSSKTESGQKKRTLSLMNYTPTEAAFVNGEKFGEPLYDLQSDSNERVVETSRPGFKVGLRDSLMLEPEFHPFRGTGSSEGIFRSVMDNNKMNNMKANTGPTSDEEYYHAKRLKANAAPQMVDCAVIKDGPAFSVLNPELFDSCDYLDTFLSSGGECFTIDGADISFPAHVVGPFQLNKFKNSPTWKKIVTGKRGMNKNTTNLGSEVAGLVRSIIKAYSLQDETMTEEITVKQPLGGAFFGFVESGEADSFILFGRGADHTSRDGIRYTYSKAALEKLKEKIQMDSTMTGDIIYEVDNKNFFGIATNTPSSFDNIVRKAIETHARSLQSGATKIKAKLWKTSKVGKKMADTILRSKDERVGFMTSIASMMGFTYKENEQAPEYEEYKKIGEAMSLFMGMSQGLLATHDDIQAQRVLSNADLIHKMMSIPYVSVTHSTGSGVLGSVNQSIESTFEGKWPIRSVLFPGMKGRNGTMPILNDLSSNEFHRANGTFGRTGLYEFDFSKVNNLDKPTTFAFSHQSHSPRDQLALQMLMARNIIQYSYGMDVAAVLFHNLAPVAYPHDIRAEFAHDSPSFANAMSGEQKRSNAWEMIVCKSTGTLAINDKKQLISDEQIQLQVLQNARKELMNRIDLTLKKSSSNERELVANLKTYVKIYLKDLYERVAYAGSNYAEVVTPPIDKETAKTINHEKTKVIDQLLSKSSDDEDLKYYQHVPTEWIYQSGSPFSRDPRMFYAGSYGQYLKQLRINNMDGGDIIKKLLDLSLESSKWRKEANLDDFYVTQLVAKIRNRKFDNNALNALDALNDIMNSYKGTSESNKGEDSFRSGILTKDYHDKIPIWTLAKSGGNGTVEFPMTAQHTPVDVSILFEQISKNSSYTGILFGDDESDPQKAYGNDIFRRRIVVLPIGSKTTQTSDQTKSLYTDLHYNFCPSRPQFFSMLDASALLWNARSFYNPSDSNRPAHFENEVDGMHYWGRTLVESFLTSREDFKRENPEGPEIWELQVKKEPGQVFPASKIGAMSDSTFSKLFPLLPEDHELRDDLRRVRALNIMWGTLPTYRAKHGSSHAAGAWMPLSVAHQMKLYDAVGLFDHKYRVPRNPWCTHNGQGLSRIFNQSYHSVYHTDSYRAPHFREWCKHACKYQVPSSNDTCYYPFSQYGGTPVEADFVPHCVEKPDRGSERRHSQLMYNRFGFTGSIRIGQQYHDTGLLQDLFSFEYKPYRDLSRKQRQRTTKAVYPSNFLSYARTHAIVALASCNHGTEQMSMPRVVRNLYRLYVDTYECMGANPDDDGVPAVMGFLPNTVNRKEDRPVILYAGTLSCLNAKLEKFCKSDRNKGQGVCQIYKQVYLNDAALLFTRLLRANRRELLHTSNFRRAQLKRGVQYTREQFNGDLINLQDAYIDFLQTTIIGMLIESGSDLNSVPLNLLEPRELEVSLMEEDDDVLGNDYLTPRTKEIIKHMDFGGDNLSRTQMAILSLIPPNNRILGTMRFTPQTEIIDLEHAKKQIQKDTIESNKKVWEKYTEALISGSFSQRLLEVSGQPMDYSFDMSAIRDPLKESESIAGKIFATNEQTTSTLSKTVRGQALREYDGPDSVLGLNKEELAKALQAVRDRVDRDFERHGRTTPKSKCLVMLKVPEHIKRILRSEYE